MKINKMITAFLLSLAMAFAVFPTSPQAAEGGISENKEQAADASADEYETGQVIMVTKGGTGSGQMRMSWPAVGDADCYLVRKYRDKNLTNVESETIVDARKFVDTEYDSSKDQYYTVTACMQTIEGLFLCGESPLLVKKNEQTGEKDSEAKKTPLKVKKKNTLRVKGRVIKLKAKKLSKTKIVLKRSRVMKVIKAKGKVTYTKIKGNKKITVNKRTGRVTIKKKLRRGTYKIIVRVKAAGNNCYKAAAKRLSFIVKVR